jgi:hypothetical protein
VHVDEPEPRRRQNGTWQETSVSDHEREVGALPAHPIGKFTGPELGGLHDGNAKRDSPCFDGGCLLREPAAGGSVRLADDRDHLAHLAKSVQRRNGELGRPEEESAHEGSLILWETPRLCRGGMRSLTIPGVTVPLPLPLPLPGSR